MTGPRQTSTPPGGPGQAVTGRLPNFFIIGAMKAGTSSLYRYLSAHPDVFMPSETKEPAFFARNWKLGVAWYRTLFRDAGDAVAVGEGSTSYSKHPTITTVPERMASLVPDARLIYLLRHPIERIKSHYAWRVMYDGETRPIDVVVLEEPAYVALSSYAMQIEHYLPHFDRGQFLLITSEELRAHRERTLRQTFEFLGADPTVQVSNLELEFNRTRERRAPGSIARGVLRLPGARRLSTGAPSALKQAAVRVLTRAVTAPDTTISPGTERLLVQRLAGDVHRLREYMGAGFDGWGIG